VNVKYQYLLFTGLVLLIVGVVSGGSDYCEPLPNDVNVTYVHEGDWYNFTITSPACYVCTDNGAGYGDVNCVPCGGTFTSNVTCGTGTFDVLFHSSLLGMNATGFYWEFGDGGNSTDENPVHTYNTTGMFDVNFKVIMDSGDSWYNVSNYITSRAEGDTCETGGPGGGGDEGVAYLGVAVLVAIILFGWFRSRRGEL
jgi:PKD repeat protein